MSVSEGVGAEVYFGAVSRRYLYTSSATLSL